MASRNLKKDDDEVRRMDIRLCRLRSWTNYSGLGIHFEPCPNPPHKFSMIDSNSPAAAGGLKIYDVVLSLNGEEMSNVTFGHLEMTYKKALATNDIIEFLVVENCYYTEFIKNNMNIDSSLATVHETPTKMPRSFRNFQKLTPRTCFIKLSANDTTFGFVTADGKNNIGMYIQTVYETLPADRAGLRKSDRIITIDGEYVDKKSSDSIHKRIQNCQKKSQITLLVADTETYEYYQTNRMEFIVDNRTTVKANDELPSRRKRLSKFFRSLIKSNSSSNIQQKKKKNDQNIDPLVKPRLRARSSSINDLSAVHNVNDLHPHADRKDRRVYGSDNINIYRSDYEIVKSFNNNKVTNPNDYGRRHEISDDSDDSETEDVLSMDKKPNQPKALSSIPQLQLSPRKNSIKVSNGTISICSGDLSQQQVDIIVIASTSDGLVKSILKQVGTSVATQYEKEKSRTPDQSIQTNGGNLSCKRIYFIPCKKLYKTADKWVFRNFISEAIDMAANDQILNVRSIAFPAIGCGGIGCDVNFVAGTLIRAVHYKLEHQPSLQLNVHFVIQQSQQTVFNSFENELYRLSRNSSKAQRKPTHIPLNLIPVNPYEVKKISLSPKSEAYAQVLNQFNSTMTTNQYKEIVRIEHIWNKRWYHQYIIHSNEFRKRLHKDTEEQLFHGCSEEAANNIIKEYFNRSYAGKHGTSYGCGVYFSSNASYSHNYAHPNSKGERCMFMALVLIGNTIKGNSSMKTCPTGYDSTTDGSHIYVTYHDSQAFGKYLITYK